MNPRGLTDAICNFGSGGRVTSGFALCKRYVVCLFSFLRNIRNRILAGAVKVFYSFVYTKSLLKISSV